MKDLKDMLNESLLLEASSQWNTNIPGSEVTKGLDALNCNFKGNKKYGFVMYMINEETVTLIATDNAHEWAEPYDIDDDQVEPAFKLKIGESMKLDQAYIMRIW